MDRDHALGAEAPTPSRSELEKWLRFAAAASAITCTRKGSDPPTFKEVQAALGA
jgi:fructokinase